MKFTKTAADMEACAAGWLIFTCLTACMWLTPTPRAGAAPAAQAAEPPYRSPASGSVPWDEILGPAQGTLPAPRPALAEAIQVPTLRSVNAWTNIRWDNDLKAALETALAEDRPVFLTIRCLPCRTCSEFDKEVLEGGPDLDPLFRQFVTVRLTSVKDVDLRLLPMSAFQDMDVSWWGWLLSPQGQVYAVVGGRDEHSDTTRNSKAALANTLRRVLAHHYDPRRHAWKVDGPVPDLSGKPVTPVNLPGFASWLKHGEHQKIYREQNCIHCHQASEIMRQPAIDAGTFDKDRDLQIWPFPENVGIRLNRDDGLRIERVLPDSPAAKAGLRPGDSLGAAGGRRLFGQADFRAVLHRTPPADGTIDFYVVRDGKVIHTPLAVADGWKKSDLSWRASVGESSIGAAPGFWPTPADKHRDRLGIGKDAMAVQPFFGFNKSPSGPAYDAGLRPDDVIVAVDGQSPNLVHRAWLVWFRLNHEPDDEVTLRVRGHDGKAREVRYRPGRG